MDELLYADDLPAEELAVSVNDARLYAEQRKVVSRDQLPGDALRRFLAGQVQLGRNHRGALAEGALGFMITLRR